MEMEFRESRDRTQLIDGEFVLKMSIDVIEYGNEARAVAVAWV
jgi:hypothetical protein